MFGVMSGTVWVMKSGKIFRIFVGLRGDVRVALGLLRLSEGSKFKGSGSFGSFAVGNFF